MNTQAPILWRVNLLGTLCAVSPTGARIEHFQTRQTAALFAYLACQPTNTGSVLAVMREAAAEMLWPEAPPDSTRKRLAQALSWLRRYLESEPGHSAGSVLETDRHTIRLRIEAVSTDRNIFLNRLTSAERSGEPTERIRFFEEAVDLYRGEFLPGFYDDWVLRERERLTNLYLGALHELISFSEAEEDLNRALRLAHSAIHAAPHDEVAHERLVHLLTRIGHPNAALKHYERWEQQLKREENRVPAGSLRVLAETLRAAPDSSSPQMSDSLSAPLTRYFGREAEIKQVVSLLRRRDVSLITLTGTGGTGKTRFAVEAARHFRKERGPDGVFFVPLANLKAAHQIPMAIAEVLFRANSGTSSAPPAASGAWEFVQKRLSRGTYLLVLDNLEHLQNAGSEAVLLIRQLLKVLPRLKLLVTSRQRLGIGGEHEFPVLPLPVPTLPTPDRGDPAANPEELGKSPSVQLFIDRAQAVRPNFSLTESNAALIAELCERLDGIPLAIELCAAWAQILSPSQMLEKLERRFDLLVSRRSDIEPRHRTLRATIEYGYLLLPTETKELFAGLALFQGGWTLAAAESVCGVSPNSSPSLLSSLTELRERSMILAEESSVSGTVRFRMLETLREFAAEQLTFAEAEVWRQRHAAFFLRIAEETEPSLFGPGQGRALNVLEAEHDNLRAALQWSVGGNREIGMRLASALTPFWDTRGHLREGRDWLKRLLEEEATALDVPREYVPDAVLAKAWSALGRLSSSQGDFLDASRAQETALELWRRTGSESGIARALYDLGATLYRQGDSPGARSLVEESLVLAERTGDGTTVTRALNQLGNITLMEEESVSFYERSLAVARSRGDRQHTATALHNLGTVAGLRGDHVSADTYFHSALAIRRDLRDDYGVMTTLVNLGKNALLQQHLAEAGPLLAEAARLAWETGRKHVLAYCLKDSALLAFAEGRYSDGIRVLAAALGISEQISAPLADRHREEYIDALLDAKGRIGDALYTASWNSGQSGPIDQIVNEVADFAASRSPVFTAGDSANTAETVSVKEPPFQLKCVGCGETRLVRHGYAPNGKQKYRCATCGRSTRENPSHNGYDAAAKEQILAAYRAGGISLRGLTRRFGVSRNTVLAWLHKPAD